jgi:hypothetical protein
MIFAGSAPVNVADAMIIRQFSLLQPALSRSRHARIVQVRHGRASVFAALTQYVSELAIGSKWRSWSADAGTPLEL